MIFGAILAGGIGSRMKLSERPKQFLPLGNKPIIIHTLEKFLLCSKFDKIYIGINPNWNPYMRDLVDKYIEDRERIIIVDGGKERNDTIFKVINDIEKIYGESEEHIIVTHDAVRPFVTLRILEENIKQVIEFGACDTVVAATDTIVESRDGEHIYQIPRRSYMYQGQTPQSFRVSELKRVYQDLNVDEKALLTDACSIYVKGKKPVHLVAGEVSNIKITTVGDYQIAQAILKGDQL